MDILLVLLIFIFLAIGVYYWWSRIQNLKKVSDFTVALNEIKKQNIEFNKEDGNFAQHNITLEDVTFDTKVTEKGEITIGVIVKNANYTNRGLIYTLWHVQVHPTIRVLCHKPLSPTSAEFRNMDPFATGKTSAGDVGVGGYTNDVYYSDKKGEEPHLAEKRAYVNPDKSKKPSNEQNSNQNRSSNEYYNDGGD